MALQTKLVQKLSQNLLMTPQLQQAIKLLQLGRPEYLEAIEKELLENPLLEEVKEEAQDNSSSTSEAGPLESSSPQEPQELQEPQQSSLEEPEIQDKPEPGVDWEDFLESFADSQGAATPKGLMTHDDKPSLEATLSKTETLAEHLVSQIRLSDLNEMDQSIAIHVVGNLNRDGYLCCTHEEIAAECKCSTAEVARVIDFMKSLDPCGIAARDLKECLIMQLENCGRGTSLEAKIVQEHLDKIENRRLDLIAKCEQVAIEEVYKAVMAIRNLEPRPGRPFGDEAVRYVVPDIYVYKVGGEYVISLNEEGMPRLRISPYYLDMLKQGDETSDSPNRQYLHERLKAASWLIRSIHQRQQTIYKVTESIVKFQRAFLDHGISKLKPLVLKDVADSIGMHESTVSRVTTNKYVHTPQGVFELKFFFTTGIKTADGDVSSSSIKEKIKNLVAAESPDSPISDQAIVDILKKDNINIARKTVAKYREGLGIPSSSRRKKLF
ncbi:MAG: RNA polymerase sigma-54 factor [Proteobacteria bacterium]|nr:MAG: RNA polymerase sigma-54 factor [Pseudomonadota bacterium]